MDGNQLTAKYKDRERGSKLTLIINYMQEHNITIDDIINYREENETDMRRKLLKIRKKAHVKKEAQDGRRWGKEI